MPDARVGPRCTCGGMGNLQSLAPSAPYNFSEPVLGVLYIYIYVSCGKSNVLSTISTLIAMARPDDRVGEIVGVIIFFLSLSTVAVALRCYCRIRVVKTFGYEDWLAIMAHVSLHFIYSFLTIPTISRHV